MTLAKWTRRAAVEEGARPGVTRSEGAELRDAPTRIRLLEQEVEVLRRAVGDLKLRRPRRVVLRNEAQVPTRPFRVSPSRLALADGHAEGGA